MEDCSPLAGGLESFTEKDWDCKSILSAHAYTLHLFMLILFVYSCLNFLLILIYPLCWFMLNLLLLIHSCIEAKEAKMEVEIIERMEYGGETCMGFVVYKK